MGLRWEQRALPEAVRDNLSPAEVEVGGAQGTVWGWRQHGGKGAGAAAPAGPGGAGMVQHDGSRQGDPVEQRQQSMM
jgi:hypothetical protein